VTSAACTSAGLPAAFCDRAAVESYNVDADEWDDMAAHAQMALQNARCDGANATVARMYGLGQDLRLALDGGDATGAARALGRGLHTIQDNCAHKGVPNPEHAWFSLEDSCDGTRLTPDKAPDALPCAQADTAASLASFLDELDLLGVAAADLAGAESARTRKYGWMDGCNFLGEADTWDGRDSRWERDVVGAALQGDLWRGLAGDAATGDICDGDPEAITAPSAPDVDVSDGTHSCLKVHLYCLGKADIEPWADDSVAPPTESSGCSVARTDGGPGVLALVLAAALAGARRRRRG
jgi:MYXO-CTERM domain-containing protein